MRRTNKLYFTPEMVCLLLLPLQLIHYVKEYENQIYRQERALSLFWLDSSLIKKHPGFIDLPKIKRTYLTITFNESLTENNIKLAYAQLRIREILSNNDSINGIHFQFTDQAEYGTFVKLLDILIMERAKHYVPNENDLWFFYKPPRVDVNEVSVPRDIRRL